VKSSTLYWITCAVSLGGLLFGFDSGVISGCEEAIQREFGLSPFWHGLVVAGALVGTVFGALAAGRMCDRFGRKPLLVSGCAAMAAMHGLVAWQISLGEACAPWLAMLGVYGFIASVAFSASAVIWVFISEIFPPDVRAKGQSFGCIVHWAMCMLVSWLFPVAVARTGTCAFAFFAAMMLLEMVWALAFMPETKGRSIMA